MVLVTKSNSNEILRSYIDARGIKQHFIANKIGMSDQQLSNLLVGRARFTGDKAIMISKALNIPLDVFLDKSYT